MSGRASIAVYPEVNRDGSIIWIAHGHADGIPYVAEGDSEAGAEAAACELVYQQHARRHIARRKEAPTCSP